MDLINMYFKAWKTRDCQLLPRIFTQDAKYIVKPCVEEYAGLENIIKYWSLNPVTQIEPSPEIITCFPSPDNAMWFCEFRNTQKLISDNKIKITEGMILFIIRDNMFCELREFYRSRME